MTVKLITNEPDDPSIQYALGYINGKLGIAIGQEHGNDQKQTPNLCVYEAEPKSMCWNPIETIEFENQDETAHFLRGMARLLEISNLGHKMSWAE